jgi:hypothetical protein
MEWETGGTDRFRLLPVPIRTPATLTLLIATIIGSVAALTLALLIYRNSNPIVTVMIGSPVVNSDVEIHFPTPTEEPTREPTVTEIPATIVTYCTLTPEPGRECETPPQPLPTFTPKPDCAAVFATPGVNCRWPEPTVSAGRYEIP